MFNYRRKAIISVTEGIGLSDLEKVGVIRAVILYQEVYNKGLGMSESSISLRWLGAGLDFYIKCV